MLGAVGKKVGFSEVGDEETTRSKTNNNDFKKKLEIEFHWTCIFYYQEPREAGKEHLRDINKPSLVIHCDIKVSKNINKNEKNQK